MAQIKTCEFCTWWSFTYQDGHRRFGTCGNIFVQERIRVSQDYDAIENEEPTMFTEQTFGCNFFATEQGLAVARVEVQGIKKSP